MAKREQRSPARSERRNGGAVAVKSDKAPEPAVSRPGPPATALAAFESGMQALQRHDYPKAADAFRALVADHPHESALVDRARVYLDLCERELDKRPGAPATLEERLTLATAALNDNDEATAERLAGEVLEEQPDHDLALYLLAAARARRGEAESALEVLRRALAVSPDVRAQARHDADFESLKNSPEFQQLLEIPTTADADDGRKLRGGRSDR